MASEDIAGGAVESVPISSGDSTGSIPDAPADTGGGSPDDKSGVVEADGIGSSDDGGSSSTPWHTEYDFNAWDGSVDSLPESGREIGSAFHGHYSPRISALQEEIEAQKSLYDIMLDGGEDPRIGELTSNVETADNRYSDLESKYSNLESEYKEYKDSIQKADLESRESWYQDFRKTHSGVFDGGENEKRAADLVRRGWTEPDIVVELALSDIALEEAAHKYLQEGVPQGHALKIARLEMEKSSPKEPSIAARAISGGFGSGRNGSSTKKTQKNSVSLRDASGLAARRALKLAK